MPAAIAQKLLAWYARNKRVLPWRGAADPYHVWVSEIMLQQTQVDTVIPFYQRWLERFPTLEALAAAPQREVLAIWEGLGYYSRARNLHRAAQKVMSELAGQIPRTPAELLRLPGIGRYTAGAIASIAFGADAAVLDGNVKRVLARVFDFQADVTSPAGMSDLWRLAESLVPAGQAGDYNQALMDLGATICTPRAPACLLCPLQDLCLARQRGVQLQRPVRPARPVRPERIYAAGVVRKDNRVLLGQRPAEGLLGGLWAFPAAEAAPNTPLEKTLARALREEWGIQARLEPAVQILTHGFTHFQLRLHVFTGQWQAGRLRRGAGPRRWVPLRALQDYPMGKTDRRIAKALLAAPRA